MGFSRPTLAELIDRAAADIEVELPGTDARLRRSNLGALARVHAAAVHGLYGYLQWVSQQVLVDQAEAEWLVRWAGLWGITRKAAAAATGNVTLSGESGADVPIYSVLQRADGAQFRTQAAATISGGAATVLVRALEAGLAGNAASATKLSFVEPVAGVATSATVASGGLIGGRDEESDDELRSRVIARMQAPPAGGAAADYVSWARSVAGVTRAWCYPQEDGPGTVVVRFVRDGDASIIPDSGQVAEVQTYINARRPVTATVTVEAPTLLELDMEIAVFPDTSAVRSAVEAELLDMLQREATPGGRIYISRLRETVSSGAGESHSDILDPVADVVPSAGQIVTLGTITWS
ncbi:MAG: baseplate J/gp47 family protein [Burkholderiales bacterium]|nr:baseplate J/gp47 family protein [Burkholderiales bacterium]